MTHKRRDAVSRSRGSQALKVAAALALTAALLTNGPAPSAHGFAAEATSQITGLKTGHSSFHYELTRVLAVYAGFTKEEAEEIAVACEAVDSGAFTGYPINGGAVVTVRVGNTERTGGNNLFYHFARRSDAYEVAGFPGTKADTCLYFVGGPSIPTRAPCPAEGPELDQIRNWAFGGADLGDDRAPTDAPRGRGSQIPHKTLVALGIYLHSVGDSYSHELCMLEEHARTHVPLSQSCSPMWHASPLGELGPKARGLPFTKTAAREVWRGLRRYKERDAAERVPQEVERIINEYAATAGACERVNYLVNAFNEKTGETTTIPCADDRRRGSGARRRG